MTVLDPLAAQPTLWGRLRERMLLPPAHVTWLAPLVVTLIAAMLRLWNLGHPHSLAFDESYYVKDAWSLWTLGYEGVWAEGANEAFAAGDTGALGTRGAYVAHPPLGKWIIALGMGLLGPGSSVGWRLSTALVGTATVLLLYLVAVVLTRSVAVATVASGLLAIDGLAITMSRIALLDASLAFFVLLGVLCVLLDRRRALPLLERGDPESPPLWGRVLWRRPWILAAGVALGAATAVKWSGLYALAGLGLYLVVTDALARRRAGVEFWPQDAAFRQGPITFLLLVPPALASYLVSWTGWLLSERGWGRQAAGGTLSSLWKYHGNVYGFHTGLSSPHSYESPAWQWPLLIRPTSIWVGKDAETCWWSDHCIAVISTVPNPLIWYGGVAAAVWLLVVFVRGLIRRRPASAALTFPLVGLAITYAPWLLYPERTMFQFYTVVMLPYLVLALALALRAIAGRPDDPLHRRQAGERTVIVFLAVAVLLSAFYYPVWTGMDVPYLFWLIHNWMPSWI